MKGTRARVACGAALVLGLTACGPLRQVAQSPPQAPSSAPSSPPASRPGDQASAQPPAPASGEPRADQSGVVAGPVSTAYPVEGRNLRLVRRDDHLILQFDFHNGTQEPLSIDSFGLDAREQLLALVDLPRGTAYGPIGAGGADAQVAAASDARIAPGDSVQVTAAFQAPPKEAERMLVLLDGLLPVEVPITADDLADSPVLQAGRTAEPNVGPLVCKAAGPSSERFSLPSDVLFAFGSANLSPAAKAALDALHDRVDAESGAVTVDGHTDAIGTDAANRRLSQQRAAAVDKKLRESMGDDFAYTDRGHGESEPIAPNTRPDGSDDPDGRARNRRVEVQVSSERPEQARADDTSLADAGLDVQVDSVRRMSGYVLASVKVTNPGQDAAAIDYDNAFTPHELTAGQLSLSGKGGTYDLCGFAEPTYFDFIGTLSQRFAPGRLGSIPAGAQVTLWGLFPAPPGGAAPVKIEVGGLGTRRLAADLS